MRTLNPLYSFPEARFLILELKTAYEIKCMELLILDDLDEYSAQEAMKLWDALKERKKQCNTTKR